MVFCGRSRDWSSGGDSGVVGFDTRSDRVRDTPPACSATFDRSHSGDVDHDLHVVYAEVVDTVGMRELRQNPAPVLRAVEAGNEVTVSVNGRPVARIVPVEAPAWVDGERAARIYAADVDTQWESDLRSAREEDTVDDPWS